MFEKISTVKLSIGIFTCSVISTILAIGTAPNLLKLGWDIVFLVLVNISFIASLLSFISRSALSNRNIFKELIELMCASLSNIFIFASIYSYFGISNGEIIIQNIPDCLYFSIVTWTTLGYGDFSPSEGARFFAAGEAMIGYVYMAIIISIFTAAITSENPEKHNKMREQNP
jgi:hypothetical protein